MISTYVSIGPKVPIMSHHFESHPPTTAKLAAGILPFFDGWKIILLGREFRERTNSYCWMEFGGKLEEGETLAETACREANEETAGTLGVTLEQVQLAEQNGHYVDHYNDKTNMFYRMYCVKFEGEKPALDSFKENAKHSNDVEKDEWGYFAASDVVYSEDGWLPGTEAKLYSTMLVRLEKLRGKDFFETEIKLAM